eukprot:CCRYP_012506-RA/>CCRYP_012506-RA protein AED:0.04 eAED:0.04 QI:0/-1/0/1/-1/1/1/0/406
MSQLEAQSRNIVLSKELWSQFQTEARANKISTTAGVKEMLRKTHAEQQQHLNRCHSGSGDISSVKASGSLALLSSLKRSRFSDSDVSWRRKPSGGSTSNIGLNNEFFELVRPSHTSSRVSECLYNESKSSMLPYVARRSHDIEDYGLAIRGNTQSVMSLYGTQGTKTSLNSFVAIFRSLKNGLEQKQIEQQRHGLMNRVAHSSSCISPNEATNSPMLKTSRFSESDVDWRTRSSCGFESRSNGKNELFEIIIPSPRPSFHDNEFDHRNNESKSLIATKPTKRNQNIAPPQESEDSTPAKSAKEELDTDPNDSDHDDDDDDRSNNGCFEYPRQSRQKALERSMQSVSLLMECDDSDLLSYGSYKYARQSRRKTVEKWTRSSFTSSTSVGSSLLVEWGDNSDTWGDSD